MEDGFTCQKGKQVEIKEKSTIYQIDMDEITHVEYIKCITIINTINLDRIKISKPLDSFKEELSEYGFVSINHSTIVNLLNVKQYIGGCKRILELVSNKRISISRRKVYFFRNMKIV